MRDDPYFTALAVIGIVGVIADGLVEILEAVPVLSDVYLGAGIGLFVAKHLIVRAEKRHGEMSPDRVRQTERRGVLVGATVGFLIFATFNVARALT
jgi:hypothetical protein